MAHPMNHVTNFLPGWTLFLDMHPEVHDILVNVQGQNGSLGHTTTVIISTKNKYAILKPGRGSWSQMQVPHRQKSGSDKIETPRGVDWQRKAKLSSRDQVGC